MSKIDYIKLTLDPDHGDGDSGFVYVKRDDVAYLQPLVNSTGVPMSTYLRSGGSSWHVKETPEFIINLINESRFGSQRVR